MQKLREQFVQMLSASERVFTDGAAVFLGETQNIGRVENRSSRRTNASIRGNAISAGKSWFTRPFIKGSISSRVSS